MDEHLRKRFAEALTRLANDSELLSSMASMVVDDADGVLSTIRRSIERGDCPETARAAHQLKGMLSTFETGSPVVELQVLIEAARDGEHDSVRRQFAHLEPRLESLLAEISELQTSA